MTTANFSREERSEERGKLAATRLTRQFVHISPDNETAVKVGSRHGKPVVLKIRARDFKNDGKERYRSSNGVWQARYVAPEYFTAC